MSDDDRRDELEELRELTKTIAHANEHQCVRRRPGRIVLGGPFGRHVLEPRPGTMRIVVGRGAIADVRMDDASVSAAHFELIPTPEGTILRDLGSRNGTWIAGVRIREALLTTGTAFLAGRVPLCLESAEEIERASANSRRLSTWQSSPRHT